MHKYVVNLVESAIVVHDTVRTLNIFYVKNCRNHRPSRYLFKNCSKNTQDLWKTVGGNTLTGSNL